jgi:tetratricopeptide (TPR) repeat protein
MKHTTYNPESTSSSMSAPMTTIQSGLDDEELLHLAIEASRTGRHGDAITHLKEAANKSERNAKVRFLLGAEHAQIGLFDRAAEEMTAALKLDPGLVPARFQLGLLYLVHARVEESAAVWKGLDSLPENDPYLHFKRGLEALARDDFAGCEESLKRGLALNTSNPPLNRDMQKILDDVAARAGGRPQPAASEESAHVLLSAYKLPTH